jgi:hypothetical protein
MACFGAINCLFSILAQIDNSLCTILFESRNEKKPVFDNMPIADWNIAENRLILLFFYTNACYWLAVWVLFYILNSSGMGKFVG